MEAPERPAGNDRGLCCLALRGRQSSGNIHDTGSARPAIADRIPSWRGLRSVAALGGAGPTEARNAARTCAGSHTLVPGRARRPVRSWFTGHLVMAAADGKELFILFPG